MINGPAEAVSADKEPEGLGPLSLAVAIHGAAAKSLRDGHGSLAASLEAND